MTRRARAVSTRSQDPETLRRFLKALEAAKAKANNVQQTSGAGERDRFGLRSTQRKGRNIVGSGKSNGTKTLIGGEGAEQSSDALSEVDQLQRLYDIVLKNEITPMSNPPNNAQYTAGKYAKGKPQEMFLGGFFKSIKKALPAVAGIAGNLAIPGVGGLLAGSLASSLVGSATSGGKSRNKGQHKQIDEVGDTAAAAEIAEPIPITGSASYGAEFRNGGRLKQYAMGGAAKPIGGTAVEFEGPRHEGGGIPLPGLNAEVEGGETLDIVVDKKGGVKSRGVPFVFSDTLKKPGSNMTFAKTHKSMVKRGASSEAISQLANHQERIAGSLRGTESPEKMFLGGLIKGATDFLGSKTGKGILGFAESALPLIPGIANTVRGATGKVESAVQAPVNRGALDILQNERNRLARTNDEVRFNPNSAINENRRLLRTAFADRGMSDAAKAAAIAGTQVNNAGIRTDYANRETDINSRIRLNKSNRLFDASSSIARMTAGFDQYDNQGQVFNQQERLAGKAAKGNLVSTGLQQIGGVFATRQQDRLNKAHETKMIDILKAGLPNPVTETFDKAAGKPFAGFKFNPGMIR